MNKSFKVVFSKARSALMVVNEATSSIQSKGTKTVVAAAVATILSGSVLAASQWVDTVEDAKVYTQQVENGKLEANDNAFTLKDGTSPLVGVSGDTSFTLKENQRLWVTGEGKDARATGVWLDAAKQTAENKGIIYATSGKDGVTWQNRAMGVKTGTLINNGTIVAKDAYGMTVGSSDGASAEIVNGVNGKIYVEDRGVGIELGGIKSQNQTTAIATNYGKIFVSEAESVEGKPTFAIGVQIKGDSDAATIEGQQFINANTGTIEAADATAAVYVEYAQKAAVTNNGTIYGDVVVGTGATGTGLTFGEDSVTQGDVLIYGASTTVTGGKDKAASIDGNILVASGSEEGAAATFNQKIEADGLIFGKTSEEGAATAGVATVTGSLAVRSTKIAATNSALTVSGEASLGNVEIGAGSSFALTNNNNDKKVVAADSLKLAAEKTDASSFTLANGAFTTGELENKGTITIGSDNGNGDFAVTGKATNTGSITFNGAGGKLVVSDFTNTGSVGALGKGSLEVSGAFTNQGTVYANELTVSGAFETGVVTSKEGKETATPAFHFNTINLEKDGLIHVVADKDSEALKQFYTEATDEKTNVTTKTLLIHDGVWNFNGGKIQVNDNVVTDGGYDVEVGTTQSGALLDVTFTEDYNFGDISVAENNAAKVTLTATDNAQLKVGNVDLSFDNNNGSKFSVDDGAAVTAKSLTLKNATVEVGDASLAVTGDLTTSAAADTITVKDGGVLTVSATGLGFKDKEGNLDFGKGVTATVAANSLVLNKGGYLTVEGIEELSTSELEKITALRSQNSKGLINLGNATLTADGKNVVSDGKVEYSVVNNLGVVTDAFKTVTVTNTESAGFTAGGSFGLIQMKGDSDLTVAVGTTLQHNGMGDLVTYTGTGDDAKTKLKGVSLANGARFVTTGKNAVIGSVQKAENAIGTEFRVEDGSLTVEGDVSVGDLRVDTNLDVVKLNDEGVNVSEVIADTLTVNGAFTAAGVTLSGYSTVAGTANVKTLAATNGVEVTGALSADKLESGSVFATSEGAPAQVVLKTVGDKATVEAGLNSLVALGTTDIAKAQSALATSGLKIGEVTETSKGVVNSVVYVTGSSETTNDATTGESTTTYSKIEGSVIASGNTEKSTGTNVSINTDSLLIVDANGLDKSGKTAVFAKEVTIADGAKVYLGNLVNGDKLSWSDTGFTSSTDEDNFIYNGSVMLSFKKVDSGNVYQMEIKDKNEIKSEVGDVAGFDAAYALFDEGRNLGSSKSINFNNWLYTATNHETVDGFKKAAKDMASLGATTGVQAMTMDAVNQMANTVADRMSVLTQRAQGVNVWAAVNGGNFEAKTLFDGAGYDSDIYSGVLGVDFQFSCNAVLGAALTIGTADTDSKNSGVSASTDSDLVGLSIYASKTFADIWGLSADIGYLSASNDVSANGYGFGYKFSQDTDAWTIGVRGEVLTQAGPVKIVPHIGLRYTALSTDGFEAGYITDIDDQNIFQMPVGVTVSGDFETNGWTIAPKFDLSVVPTFGDKNAELKLGITGVSATDDLAVRVIDSNPVQATLGVNATNGAWGLGLNYKLGVGSDDRMNNTFNVNVRYAF